MRSPFSLEGKTILITGASSGIGKQTAISCSDLGATECILLGRNETSLKETAQQLNESCSSRILSIDLSDFSQFQEMVKELPNLDGIVLNAGINNQKLLQFSTENDFNKIFDINCFAPVVLVRHLLKNKKINRGASLIFISSISGLTNFAIGNGVYGASKSAATALMKYLALELAPKKIRCNAVSPGRIETPLIEKVLLDQNELEKDKSIYPLKRYGTPEEVAYAIIYLLSDASSWVTGTNLVIDGGRSLV